MKETELYTERMMDIMEDYSEKLLDTIVTGMKWYEAKAGYMNIQILLNDTEERMADELKDIAYNLGIDSEIEREKEYERIWENIDAAILHSQPEYTELKKKTKAELIELIYDLHKQLDDLR